MAIREDGTVYFEGAEQEALNKVVEERLARERSKYVGYDDYKGIEEELKALGYEGTASEIRSTIKAQREQAQSQVETLEQKQEDGERLTQAEKDLLAKASKFVEKSEKEELEQTQIKAQEEAYQTQRKELIEKHGVDADELQNNSKFMKFVKGKSGINLIEEYEDFVEFVGEAEAEAIKKAMSKQERSTGNGKGSSNEGGGYGLTPNQQALAKDAGMSLKDYAEGLKLIRR